MSEIFHAGDLLNSLIELERTGHHFYEMAAKTAGDERAGKLFGFLAGEEEKHERLYKELAAQFAENAPSEEPVDGEYAAYLKALVQRNFQFDSSDFSSLKAALCFAVSLEKDTLIYVGEIQTVLKDQKLDLFETIKKEERRHLQQLVEYQE